MDGITCKVYVLVDVNNHIIQIDSDRPGNNRDFAGWIQIDEGTGDKYAHAQGNYFDKPLIGENGCYNYKLVDGKPVERTADEISADITTLSDPQPTVEQQQFAAMALTQAQQAATIAELQQTNAALILKIAGGNT